MDANLDKIAKDLYGKIQTRFSDIKIGDENAAVLSKKEDIPKARFFEFEYEEDGESLGTIAITLDADDGVVVQVSGDLVNDDVETDTRSAFKFIRSFRQFAKDRLLNFDVQNIGKSNMDKRDYHFQAKRKELPMEPMMENKMFGTSKISYQDLGETRLVVKHSQPVNTELAAGRTMHIEAIYIENAGGERFRYPAKHLNGARALAEHIKHGGNPYDAIGKHITSLSEELAQLRKFKGFVNRTPVVSESMSDVNSQVMERIEEIKKQVHGLQRTAYYEQFAETFEAHEEQMIPEAVMTDWIDRLTVRTFNEELKSVFPYIFKLVGESGLPVKGITPDEMLDDAIKPMPKDLNAPKKVQDRKTGKWYDPQHEFEKKMSSPDVQAQMKRMKNMEEDAFESFVNRIVSEDKDELFSPNKDAQHSAIEKLNDIMSHELKGGPEGINAVQSLTGLIDDPEFLNSLRDIDPDLDVRPLVQQFILAKAPEIAAQINFGGEEEIAPAIEAPLAPAPEAPAPVAPEAMPVEPAAAPVAPEEIPVEPAPVAEGVSASKSSKLKAKFIKAKELGATLETVMDFGSRAMTLGEAIKECGMTPQDVGFEQESAEHGVHQILKSIAGFWNKENRNFTIGGTRAKTKVLKGYKDGEYPNAGPHDVKRVIGMIEKMDPSSDASGQQQQQIIRLSGAGPRSSGAGGPDQHAHLASAVKQMGAQQHPADMIKGIMQKLNFGK